MHGRENPRPVPDAWRTRAACAGVDPGLFLVPEKHTRRHIDTPEMVEARQVCRGCPVGAECETDGHLDAYTIRNGRTPWERSTHLRTSADR
jgi:hypothetical protein